MKTFFIFDVESIGLHGEGFAVAGGVYLSNGAAQYEFGFACDPALAWGDDDDRKWVAANVPVLDVTHRSPAGIREAFWMEWLKAVNRYPEIQMAVECGWPVEARFLCDCVGDDIQARKWQGPLPLLEISSHMSDAGMDTMKNYQRTPSETPAHNPLCDARLSARLLAEALTKLGIE
jgi:hypothetical protein